MNANGQLNQYNRTEHYYRYLLGFLITDGVKALAIQFECYWFLDIIVSYQPVLTNEGFQVWELIKHLDGSATVICTNGNNRELKRQEVGATDFACSKATVWMEGNVLLLPSEH